MKNNICVFTGSRSEFGIYKILIDKLNKSKINFSLVVSGSHLSNNFGKTYDETTPNTDTTNEPTKDEEVNDDTTEDEEIKKNE